MKSIVVESLIRAPVEVVWEETQNPVKHLNWDIRFSEIAYLNDQSLLYTTHLGFGLSIKGQGRYLNTKEHGHSSFEFWSEDPKSLLKMGKGIWIYETIGSETYFKTVFDYDVNFGSSGKIIDLIFRRLFCWATEYSFELLRIKCETKADINKKWSGFLIYVLKKPFQFSIKARTFSWLGNGHKKFSKLKI